MTQELMKQWEEASEGISPLEEFIGTITSARFDTASNVFGSASPFGRESIVLALEVTVDQPIDPADFAFDTAKVTLPVGEDKNWNLLDGGDKIISVNGARMGNSRYQRMIARVTKDLKVPLQERGMSPFQAKVWTGLKFHWKREGAPIPAQFIREGGPTESFTMLPQAWLQDKLPPLV